MYLWVVLTTFLAMLAAYILPIRADMEELVDVPVAQAKLIQMVVKQNAGKQRIRELSWPYWGGASNEYDRHVGYKSGKLDVSSCLPVGFVDNEDFVTAVYCMDENLTTIRTGISGCWRTDTQKTKRLLITFGAIPERWQTINVTADGGYEVWPSADMMGAMRAQFGTKTMAGYVVKEGGKLSIINYEKTLFEIPAPVANDGSVVSYSLKKCLADYKSCLAIMSWQ